VDPKEREACNHALLLPSPLALPPSLPPLPLTYRGRQPSWRHMVLTKRPIKAHLQLVVPRRRLPEPRVQSLGHLCCEEDEDEEGGRKREWVKKELWKAGREGRKEDVPLTAVSNASRYSRGEAITRLF